MANDGTMEPVQRFEFSTQEEGETECFIRQMYVGNRMQFHRGGAGNGFAATVAEVPGIASDHIRVTVNYSAACDPFDYFFFISPYAGRIQVRSALGDTIATAGETTYFPLGVPLDIHVSTLGMRSLRLPVAQLGAAAAETAGIAPQDLRFDAATPVSAALGRHWCAMIELFSGILLDPGSLAANPLLAQELTRTAAVTALHTFPNTAMTVSYQPGPGWTAPAAVRRAAGYIHAHADQPVTMEQVAAAAGLSTWALQDAFRRHLGATPAVYLRRVRLERADRELRQADPASGGTVAAVAHRWGWVSPARFTAAYRSRFGVLPSQTLRTPGG